MNRDKQIEEMAMVLTESQHAFDRARKECLHNNAPMPDRENVFYAKYLVEKEGYRKASDVAREIFEEIDELLMPFGYQLKTISLQKYIKLKKKYTEEVK